MTKSEDKRTKTMEQFIKLTMATKEVLGLLPEEGISSLYIAIQRMGKSLGYTPERLNEIQAEVLKSLAPASDGAIVDARWTGELTVDAGNISILDAGVFGGEPTLEVKPGKYKINIKMNCWKGDVAESKVVELKTGKVYIGDCCYIRSPHYSQMIDAMCEGKKLDGFCSFNTGGDGLFSVVVELTQV